MCFIYQIDDIITCNLAYIIIPNSNGMIVLYDVYLTMKYQTNPVRLWRNSSPIKTVIKNISNNLSKMGFIYQIDNIITYILTYIIIPNSNGTIVLYDKV